jgi:hypothetical protein
MIGFIDTLYIQLGATGNYSDTAISTRYSSPLHTHQGSQSSLVVSWQRIHNTPTAHMKSSLHNLIPFLPFLLKHLRLPSFSVPCCNCQLRNSTQFNSSAPKLISRQAGVSKLNSQTIIMTSYDTCTALSEVKNAYTIWY